MTPGQNKSYSENASFLFTSYILPRIDQTNCADCREMLTKEWSTKIVDLMTPWQEFLCYGMAI